MVEELPIFFQALVWLNLYWYVFLLTFIPSVYYIFIRIVSFPLAANKAHEFVIVARPEKAIIKKVSNRIFPFFHFKKGLYWFSSPSSDVNSFNKYHIYIEGINQDVTEMERRESKLDDLLQTNGKAKQIVGHQIRLPLKLKDHLHKHWALTVDAKKKLAILSKVREAQSFRISLYHTIGIYIQEEEQVEEEMESASGGQSLTQLTNQTVVQQIKYVQGYSYFSSNSAFNLWKKRSKIEMLFVAWLKGSADPRLMAALIVGGSIMAVVALLIFGGVFE